MILIAAAGCALAAGLLAAPVPNRLARAGWTLRRPRAAIVLWQLVGLGGGGLMLLALALVVLSRLPAAVRVVAVIALIALAGWLLGVLLVSSVRVIRKLARQRRLVDLVASGTGGVRVIEHPELIAYCLPGTRPRVVVSRGTLDALEPDELAAVLAHERAHARGRHELVVQPFVAWERTFPFLLAARRARLAVTLLVEILADDQASAAVPPEALASALVRLGGGACGDDAMVRARVVRLARG
ncbi:MAG TPA: M56 family metallopeptidase [Mycobacteriales bacterium]|nr:M56 family metallopeptidase [Mycobacteriales bacterium]